MDVKIKDITNPFKEKHEIQSVKNDAEYNPTAIQERKKRINENDGLSLYGKPSRKNANRNIRPERYRKGMKFPNQSADHTTDPLKPNNPHYPYISDEECEKKQKEKPVASLSSAPSKDSGMFNYLLDLVNDSVDKMTPKRKEKVSNLAGKLNNVVKLLQNKLQGAFPISYLPVIDGVKETLTNLVSDLGKRNPKKTLKFAMKKIRKAIEPTALAQDLEFAFLFAKLGVKERESEGENKKAQPKEEEVKEQDIEEEEPPKKKNQKHKQRRDKSQKKEKEFISNVQKEQIQPLKTASNKEYLPDSSQSLNNEQPKPSSVPIDFDKINGKINDLISRVEGAIDEKKKIDDDIHQKEKELEDLKKKIEDEKKKLKDEQDKNEAEKHKEAENKKEKEEEKEEKKEEKKETEKKDAEEKKEEKETEKKKKDEKKEEKDAEKKDDEEKKQENAPEKKKEKDNEKDQKEPNSSEPESSRSESTDSQSTDPIDHELPNDGDACECLLDLKLKESDIDDFLSESIA